MSEIVLDDNAHVVLIMTKALTEFGVVPGRAYVLLLKVTGQHPSPALNTENNAS